MTLCNMRVHKLPAIGAGEVKEKTKNYINTESEAFSIHTMSKKGEAVRDGSDLTFECLKVKI